jgi:hypothetical protein
MKPIRRGLARSDGGLERTGRGGGEERESRRIRARKRELERRAKEWDLGGEAEQELISPEVGRAGRKRSLGLLRGLGGNQRERNVGNSWWLAV